MWQSYVQDIDPLRQEDALSLEVAVRAADSLLAGREKAPERPVTRAAPPVKTTALTPQTPQLDFRTDQRLKRGQVPIDARLDLHGKTQDQAHRLLNNFVMSAHGRGDRCVLVITGKGRGGLSAEDAYAPDLPAGVLKRRLPEWLEQTPLREIVLKTSPAHARHGGSGAFYIYLKRTRDYTHP